MGPRGIEDGQDEDQEFEKDDQDQDPQGEGSEEALPPWLFADAGPAGFPGAPVAAGTRKREVSRTKTGREARVISQEKSFI